MTKQILLAAALTALLAALGWLWSLAMGNTESSIRNQERIETNTDRITTIKQDSRVEDIVNELREIKQILK